MLRIIAVALLGLTATLAHAGPTELTGQTIRIIVPYTAGGPSDVVSRVFATEFGKTLGATVIVENKPGAGTAIGSQSARLAPADGRTLLFGSSTFIIATLTMKEPGYSVGDFTPVAHLGDTFFVLATPKLPEFSELASFLSHARKNPGRLNYATLGPGSIAHLLANRLGRIAGVDWQDVAYRGTPQSIQAVMTNEVQGYFTSQGTAASLRDSDKIQMLAIASERRSSVAPWIPTFAELGFPAMTEPAWYALFARSDMAPALLETIRHAASIVMSSEAMVDQQSKLGLSPYPDDMSTFSKLIAAERISRADELKRVGIVPQ